MFRHLRATTVATLIAALVTLAGCASQSAAPPAPAPTQSQAPAAPAAPKAEAPAAQPAPAQPAKAAAPSGPPAKVRIGNAVDTLGYAPVYLAVRRGYFKELGLDVERTTLQGGSALNAAFLAGDIDVMATSANTGIEMLQSGKDAQIIYALSRQNTFFLTVTPKFIKDRGVDLKASPQEKVSKLKGITLGAPSLGGYTEVVTRLMTRAGGLEDKDVNVVKVGSGSALVAALEHNQVDGFAQPPPAPNEAVRRGVGVVVLKPSEIPLFGKSISSTLITSQAYGAKNSTVLQRLAYGLDRAKQDLVKDFEGAVQDIKKDFPKMEDDSLRESLQVYMETYGTDGKMDVEAWKWTLQFLKDAQVLTGKFDQAEGLYWTNRYLP